MIQALNILLISFVALGVLPSMNETTQANHAFAFQYATQKPNESEDAEVEKAVKSFIDLMFRERKVTNAFEQHFFFSNLTPKEKSVVDAISLKYSDEYVGLDAKVVARILSAKWNYEYQPVFLALGTKPLSDFEDAFEEAESEIEVERKRILNQRGLTENDFYTFLDLKATKDHKTLENNLTKLELISTDLERFIEQRINKTIFNKNLVEMEKSVAVKKLNAAECVLYLVGIKPMFKLVFVKETSGLKMIGFGNVL